MSFVHELTANPIGQAVSKIATEDIPVYRFVALDGSLCGAGEKALGVSGLDIPSGKVGPVDMLGILIVEAGGTVTAGGEVESDSSGRAVDKAAGIGNGYALTAATTAGQKILVVRGI